MEVSFPTFPIPRLKGNTRNSRMIESENERSNSNLLLT